MSALEIELDPQFDTDDTKNIRRASRDELAKLRDDLSAKDTQLHTLQAALDMKVNTLDTYIIYNRENIETIAKLQAALDEWENAKKFVADGCKDEQHCGCVPILKRQLDEARKVIEPFAELADTDNVYWKDEDKDEYYVAIGHFRNAAAWLASHPKAGAE
jgi:hypothetical protein